MHVITNKKRRGNRTYTYTQIVRSYRNARGISTHKVLASFPELTQLEVDNLKVAIKASRESKAVILAEDVAQKLQPYSVVANLRYLDVAVVLNFWHRCGVGQLLSRLVSRLVRQSEVKMPVVDVIAALTIHRCVAPGSKLAATRWYPTTALPELQAVPLGSFNNTRVHRALEVLEQVEEPLQERLAKDAKEREGAFVSLFLDITNTWFEGRGPPMASKGRVKEGPVKQRIGIALLCDQRGLPLRWKTLPGSYHEATVMPELVTKIAALEWVGQTPVVIDRIMGRAGAVELLAGSGLRFVTALPVDEYDSHTNRIPHQVFTELEIAATDASHDSDLRLVRKAAKRAGLVQVSKKRYVLDLGVLPKGEGVERTVSRAKSPPRAQRSRVVKALELARTLGEERKTGVAKTIPALAKRHRRGAMTIKRHLRLLKLTLRLQERILAGEVDGATIGALDKIARLPRSKQAAAFDRLCETVTQTPSRRPRRNRHDEEEEAPPIKLRYVVHFNPELLIEKRRKALGKLRELDAFVSDLNRRLRSPSSRREEASVRAEVEGVLRQMKLVSVFDVDVEPVPEQSTPTWVVHLRRDDEAWKRRRRYDGFNVIVAEPELPHRAQELVELYFAKDMVEKDIQTIKSEVALRPLRHRTNSKVCAHVTLCMLALLLMRTMEQRLREAETPTTAPATFETLATCHLNQCIDSRAGAYTITRPTDEQQALLRALDLDYLFDDEVMAEQITPR